MLRFENCINKARVVRRTALVSQRFRAAGLALTITLLAVTLAAPASAWKKPDTIIGTISIGSPTGIPGNGPTGVAVDPVRGIVYVCNTNYTKGLGTISVIDEATNTVTATITVGHYPYAIAVDPIHWTVWVTNYLDATVSAIDERTNTVVATLPVGSTPHDIALDPFRGTVYVANDGGKSVTVIDEATLTVTTTVPSPNSTYLLSAVVDPVRGLAGFGGGFGPSSLFVLDERTNQFINTITLTTGQGAVERLAVDPLRGNIYAPQYYAGTVQVIDERTETVTSTIVASTATYNSNGYSGPGTGFLGLDLVTGYLYAVQNNVDTVAVIDPIKRVLKDTITIPNAGNDLGPIGVDPIRGLAYVSNNNNNSVSIISIGNGSPCQDLQNYALLPLLCKTDLYKSQPGQDRPSWPWVDALDIH